MEVKIFILGRPGSGKSYAARQIVKLASINQQRAIRINDYSILFRMSEKAEWRSCFIPTKGYRGFDVINFSVLDIALKKAALRAKKAMRFNDIVVIEFARDDYVKALKQFEEFDTGFLKNAYFVFLDTDLDACIQRVHQRVDHPKFPDDHFVSDNILRDYYDKQILPANLQSQFVEEFAVEKERVMVIDNKGIKRRFDQKINQAFSSILGAELNKQRKADRQKISKTKHQPVRKTLAFLYAKVPRVRIGVI